MSVRLLDLCEIDERPRGERVVADARLRFSGRPGRVVREQDQRLLRRIFGAQGLPLRPRSKNRAGEDGAGDDQAHGMAPAGRGQAKARSQIRAGGCGRDRPRGGSLRWRPCHGRVERSAPGQPSGAEQRDACVAGDVPRPVDQRVDSEDDNEREHAQHPDALRAVGSRAAFGHPTPPAAPLSRAALEQRAPSAPAPVEGVGGAPGGGHPGGEQHQREHDAEETEIGERLNDETVRVPDVQRLGAVAQARGRVAFRAHPQDGVGFEDFQCLLPVLGANAADCCQAPGRVGHLRVRVRDRASVSGRCFR